MKFEMENKPLNVFNFSSLTDIVLLLLIFFLLTSQFVIQTGVKVKLPGSKTNEQTLPSQLIVTITPDSKIYLGSDLVGIDGLPMKLESASQNNSDKNLIIRADKEVNIDLVIKVIDAAKGVGIDKFTIQTEKESF
ncbi:MAG: biopolymer transporter [Ignavibacteriae bacterium]|nr:biopolymer transporter [Ignavibacteriota bacterium]